MPCHSFLTVVFTWKAHLTFFFLFLFPLSYKQSHAVVLQTVLAEHSCSLFPFFAYNSSTPLHPVLVDGHSSFPILLNDSGMIRCPSLYSSTSDGHAVLHGAFDCHASSFSFLSLNCSYSDFLIYDFSGRSDHLLFPSQSQCKPYSASTSCLIPRIFSKTFCRLPCIQ